MSTNIYTIILYFNLLILFSAGCILPFLSNSNNTIFGVRIDETFHPKINFIKLYLKHYIITSLILFALLFKCHCHCFNANLFILFTIFIVFNIYANYLIINHKIIVTLNSNNPIFQNNSSLWKFGIFYYNPQDPSLFLKRRSGNGFAINWAKKTVWLMLLVILIPICLILI